MKILLTSGGTQVPIDGVRHIGNMSSGRFGSEIAKEILSMGRDDLWFLHAVGSKTPFSISANDYAFDLRSAMAEILALDALHQSISYRNGEGELESLYHPVLYKTYYDYSERMSSLLKKHHFDVIILSAAVSDFGVDAQDAKITSSSTISIDLKPLPKIISWVRAEAPKSKIIGFKLLVNSTQEQLIAAAQKSLEDNALDAVVANDLSSIRRGKHELLWVTKGGVVEIKGENVAEQLVRIIEVS